MRGKKADLQMSYNAVILIIRMFFLIFVAISIIMLIRHFIILNIDVGEAEARILMNRFVFSQNCLAYTNQRIYRPYPGVVDLERFKQSVLDECVNYGERNEYAAAKLTLNFLDNSEEKSIMFNHVGYDIWLPRVGKKGAGGAKEFFGTRYVLVIEEENQRPAILEMEVITPNY